MAHELKQILFKISWMLADLHTSEFQQYRNKIAIFRAFWLDLISVQFIFGTIRLWSARRCSVLNWSFRFSVTAINETKAEATKYSLTKLIFS